MICPYFWAEVSLLEALGLGWLFLGSTLWDLKGLGRQIPPPSLPRTAWQNYRYRVHPEHVAGFWRLFGRTHKAHLFKRYMHVCGIRPEWNFSGESSQREPCMVITPYLRRHPRRRRHWDTLWLFPMALLSRGDGSFQKYNQKSSGPTLGCHCRGSSLPVSTHPSLPGCFIVGGLPSGSSRAPQGDFTLGLF